MEISEDVQQRLIGTWRLVRWEVRLEDGSMTCPLGEDAVGQIQYSADGRMSAQLMRSNQPRFARDDWRRATVDEKAQAWSNYFGYFGTYTIDDRAKVVAHHIEGSWFPNLVAATELRHYRFDGEQLVLDADTPWGRVHIIWEKIAANSAAFAQNRLPSS
jgi:hypothetical protein